MSYILDALRKSERQRPPGPVPDLFSVQGPLPPERRRLSPAAVGVALACGGAVLLAVWAWLGDGGSPVDVPRASAPPSGSARSAEDVAPQAAPAPAVDAAREVVGDAPHMAGAPASSRQISTAPALSRPAVARAPVAAVVPRLAERAAPAASATSAATASATGAQPPGAVAVPAPPVASLEPAVSVTSVPAQPMAAPRPADLAAEAPPADAPTVPAAAVDLPDPSPPADGRVLELADLPASIRGELPALEISGHVWSDEAGLRLLAVRDRIVRAGDEAAPGVRLEEITQSGAVLGFRGWRFRVSGF